MTTPTPDEIATELRTKLAEYAHGLWWLDRDCDPPPWEKIRPEGLKHWMDEADRITAMFVEAGWVRKSDIGISHTPDASEPPWYECEKCGMKYNLEPALIKSGVPLNCIRPTSCGGRVREVT